VPELNRGTILHFMREVLHQLSERDERRYSTLIDRTLGKLSHVGLVEKKLGTLSDVFRWPAQKRDPFVVLLTEGYQQLIALGYIVPQADQNGPRPGWFAVTDIGRQWAAGSDPVPEDPQGYLAALEAVVPNLDSAIREYTKEALVTYERHAFFASAVMIGAASEKAVYLLMDALVEAINDPNKKKAVQKTINEKRRLPEMFKQLRDNISRAKSSGAMSYDIHEGADLHLLSLQEAIRVQRNDAVHPKAGQVSPEMVRLTLSAFPAACKKVYDLMKWLKNNQL
jgi:hypothetical protein